MKQARLIDVDYYDFQVKLQKAVDVGGRIEPREKEKWSQYIKEHNIKEAAFLRMGDAKYEKAKPVIIDHGSSWDGIYMYSKDAEAVLKWVEDDG